jgi:hypothetical protein
MSGGGIRSTTGAVLAFGILWSEWRQGDSIARGCAGVLGGPSRQRVCSAGALGFHAPPCSCCEGRREPSVGDPMKHRRFRKSVRADSSAGSWSPSDCGSDRRPRIRQARGHESRVSRRGRRRRRRAPQRGPASRKRHPRARGAGAVPSRDQHTTVERRRWISLGSGRFAIPHPGRTQPNPESTQFGVPTQRTRFGGTWA